MASSIPVLRMLFKEVRNSMENSSKYETGNTDKSSRKGDSAGSCAKNESVVPDITDDRSEKGILEGHENRNRHSQREPGEV
jgi:hypothetical protein